VSFGFCVKGTLGILVNAYRSQLINDKELDGIFHVIEKRSDIWLSKKLCRQVLQKLYSDESKK
jgi:predicted nucleic acid-binding protein